MSWTDERVELLTKLWGEGKTAAEIAKELGGVTRNAVIGKAHRLKLSSRVSPIQQNKQKKAVSNQNKAAPTPAPKKTKLKDRIDVPLDVVMPQNKALNKPTPKKDAGKYSLADLSSRMCRWPIGDPKEENFGFCGETIMTGIPYCRDHAHAAYQPATRNRLLKAEDFENTNAGSSTLDDQLKDAVANA